MELPAPGQIFHRKYKLQEILGRGGFAAVYRATDVEIGRDVAIKMLAPGDDGYEDGVKSRFKREAKVIAGLQDPHTITMFDYGESQEGLLFMVFEYVRGEDLSQVIRKRGPMSHEQVVHVMRQLLQALREAHAAGVLHRDIKPANVLLYNYMGDEFRVKLLDFGIAKPVAPGVPGTEDSVNITRAGALVGTPRYMSPEQIYGGELTDASDLYSLGLVAHEMLVGKPAIRGSSTKEMILAQLSDEPVRLPMNVHASPGLRRLIDRLTAREASARFANAEEALRALDELDLVDYTGPPPPTQNRPPSGRMTAMPQSPNTMIEDVSSSQFYPDITPQPTLEEQRKAAVSSLAIVALGLAVGAGVVLMLILIAGDDPRTAGPPSPPPPEERTEWAESPPDDEPTIAAPDDESTLATDVADVGPTEEEEEPVISGCGKEATFKGRKEFKAKVGFSLRSWITYIPKNYDPERPHPIVLLFHETTKSGNRILDDTKLERQADREGLILVAPDAKDKTTPWSDRSDADAIATAVEETAEMLCVDRSKIFAVGHGAGGLIAEELGCHMPLSGVAVSGYTPDVGKRLCVPNPPVPYIHLHGDRDRYAPINGGSPCIGGNVVSLATAEETWRERNRCGDERSVYLRKGKHTCYTWDCDASFVSCHLKGGHDWPEAGAEIFELPNCIAAPAKFPYGQTIWDFFEKHGREIGEDEQ